MSDVEVCDRLKAVREAFDALGLGCEDLDEVERANGVLGFRIVIGDGHFIVSVHHNHEHGTLANFEMRSKDLRLFFSKKMDDVCDHRDLSYDPDHEPRFQCGKCEWWFDQEAVNRMVR